MRKSIAIFLLAVIAAIPPCTALAVPVTVPSGLNPGDQYRLAFVTSTTRNATSTNIADYNTFVTTAANSVPALAALGTSWKAIGSTNDVDARDNTSTNPLVNGAGFRIYDLANTLVATTNTDLWNGDIQVPLNHREDGTVPGAEYFVWTGTDDSLGVASNGTAYQAFGEPDGVTFGSTIETSHYWMDIAQAARENSLHMYALSGVLTVVPEPSTMVLGLLAAAALVAAACRRRN